MTDRPSLVPRDTPRPRRAAWLLTISAQQRRVVEQHIALNSADMRLLWLLNDGKPRTLREISEQLELEQSTVNRQVNAARTAGLVRRFREPGHTALLVGQSDEGRALFDRELARGLGPYAAALDALGEDADRFLDLLDRFVAAHGEAVHALPPREG